MNEIMKIGLFTKAHVLWNLSNRHILKGFVKIQWYHKILQISFKMLTLANFGRKLSATCLWQHQKSVVSLSTRLFQSDLSLEKLYPTSKQQIFTPANVSFAIFWFFSIIWMKTFVAHNKHWSLQWIHSLGPGTSHLRQIERPGRTKC